MEEYILSLVNYVSLDTILISFIIFCITMIIKTPIKNITSSFEETKRKAINSFIIIIPIILSILLNLIYIKTFVVEWTSFELIKSIMNSWILSLSIYAIFKRIRIIIKAFIKGELDQENLEIFNNEIKNEIEQLLQSIETNQRLLDETKDKLTRLNNSKKVIQSNPDKVNIATIFQANVEIGLLTQKELTLQNEINKTKQKLENINKGEF